MAAPSAEPGGPKAVTRTAGSAGRSRRPAYALCCDDSGGEDDALRSVASVSGPALELVALERALRRVLSDAGLPELKWAALRTRRARLAVARTFLELAAQALGRGRLRLEVLLWRPAVQAALSRSRTDAERLRPVYGRLWRGALGAWPPGPWALRPDQRTGMRWNEQATALNRDLGAGSGGARVRAVREAASHSVACVQLADLLAGLCRIEDGLHGAAASPDTPAWRQRRALRFHFIETCRCQGIAVRTRAGLLSARHRRLNIRLLRRLPVRP